MTIQVKSEEYHDGVGLTWDDTGQPLSKREGQAWWAGWDEGRKDGEVDTREELADEIERLRSENQELKLQYLSDQGQWIEETGRLREALREIRDFDTFENISNEECMRDIAHAALGEKE